MTDKTLKELNDLVVEWAIDRGIFEKATKASQYEKTCEEVGELGRYLIDYDKEQVEDAIGDIIVTLILQAEQNGTSIEKCLNQAYDVISKRSGKMINGVFVKDK